METTLAGPAGRRSGGPGQRAVRRRRRHGAAAHSGPVGQPDPAAAVRHLCGGHLPGVPGVGGGVSVLRGQLSSGGGAALSDRAAWWAAGSAGGCTAKYSTVWLKWLFAAFLFYAGGEVSAVTEWLIPLLCGLGAGILSAWGVGGGTILLLVMTLLAGCGPADSPGHQPAVLPAHRRQRPGVPRQERLSGQAQSSAPQFPGRWRRRWPGPGSPRRWTRSCCASPSA